MLKTIPFLLVLFSSSASAAQPGLLGELRGFAGRAGAPSIAPFTGAAPAPASGPWMPAPSDSDWGDGVPSIGKGAPVAADPARVQDAFRSVEACQVVDFVNVRQPSVQEALDVLRPCLDGLSQRYGVVVTAAPAGDGKGLLLVINGIVPASSPVRADLQRSLALREGRLFGHPARINSLERPGEASRPSSLQVVLDRCPRIAVIEELKGAPDFIRSYGDCLRRAKNLAITDVRPDPADAGAILVYSREHAALRMEMAGMVEVPSLGGPLRLRVVPLQELAGDRLLPAASLLFR